MGHIMATLHSNPMLMWPPKMYVSRIKKKVWWDQTRSQSTGSRDGSSEKKIKDGSWNHYECKKCLYGTYNERKWTIALE